MKDKKHIPIPLITEPVTVTREDDKVVNPIELESDD